MPLNLAIGSARLPIQIGCEPPTYTHARWKGIPFHVETTSDEFGRRGDSYEYPLGEHVGYKDLGRRARRYKVEGYLIGTQQVALTRQMVNAAESREPGYLDHPMYGAGQLVACVSLTVTADYRRDKKRTKLAFEFIEAAGALAPFATSITVNKVWQDANAAAREAFRAGGLMWGPSSTDLAYARAISYRLSQLITPRDEASFDARDMLARVENLYLAMPTFPDAPTPPPIDPPPYARALTPLLTTAFSSTQSITFMSVAAPIDYGSATIARLHKDALEKLREFNAYVVNRQEATPSVQALVMSTRLIIMRDYATAAMQRAYETVKAALDDLDFIMQVFDEEEALATQRCDDVLVMAIVRARATAAAAILGRNIRLPGIAEWPVDGVWPSLVVAHKLYADGTRHAQVENYNPTMLPFWMGRDLIAPTK